MSFQTHKTFFLFFFHYALSKKGRFESVWFTDLYTSKSNKFESLWIRIKSLWPGIKLNSELANQIQIKSSLWTGIKSNRELVNWKWIKSRVCESETKSINFDLQRQLKTMQGTLSSGLKRCSYFSSWHWLQSTFSSNHSQWQTHFNKLLRMTGLGPSFWWNGVFLDPTHETAANT